jgi:hypothetical protein
LVGTGLSISGSPITTSGTLTANVSYGTTAGTACQGNDSRIVNILKSGTSAGAFSGGAGGTIDLSGGNADATFGNGGPAGTINLSGGDAGNDGASGGGSINLSGGSADGGDGGSISLIGNEGAAGSINLSCATGNNGTGAGGSITSTGFFNESGGSLNMSGGTEGGGGNINTSDDGGSINTRDAFIELGRSTVRTTLIGTATANRAISLPNSSGTLALNETFAAPPAIGSTTPAAGTFTTLTANTSLTLGTSGILTGGTNLIEQVNSTNAQTFRIYNTFTNASNYERASLTWASNRFSLIVDAAGTGTARGALIRVGSNQSIILDADVIECRSAGFTQRFGIQSSGVIVYTSLLQFGGTTSSAPALKRSSTALQVRLADDSAYSVLDAQLRAQGTAPATSGAAGTAGDIRYDADYIYVATATNTWKRAAIATW